MAFDFKQAEKALYRPGNVPVLVEVPRMYYLAVRGEGDPNEPGGEYQRAVSALYAVAYTLKMGGKHGHPMEGWFDYVVPPLESFWRQAGADGCDYSRKADFQWTSVIGLPEFVTETDVEWAVAEAGRKKKIDCSAVRRRRTEEGLCVQALHTGPFDSEPATIARMNAWLAENGYENDLSDRRQHHEIYLSDPRKVPPEQRKTVLRHPVRRR